MRADIARQDRPGHVGKTAGEERRGGVHQWVCRVEPGGENGVSVLAGFPALCTSVRAAFRQPSKSVSLSRVIKRVWRVLNPFDSIGESPRIQIRLTPQALLALY